jgi:hypothetical protein
MIKCDSEAGRTQACGGNQVVTLVEVFNMPTKWLWRGICGSSSKTG